MVSSHTYEVGTMLWVYGKNTDVLLHCRVTDISAPKDRQRHIRTGRVIEAGYTEAIRLCGRKHMHDPPAKCPVTVVKLS
jgi:hypothetical protein